MTASVATGTSRKFTEKQAAVINVELAAILSSDSFSNSRRCQDFLQFVVGHALEGDFESLTERFLGVELFGRAVNYETATDSIVRVRANDVRRRLAQYYSSTGSTSLARIDLVAGGYVPEFQFRSDSEARILANLAKIRSGDTNAAALQAGPETERLVSVIGESTSASSVDSRRLTRTILWWSTVALATLVVVLTLFHRFHGSNFERFWRPVLEASGSPVLNLPTTDTIQLTMDPMRTLNPVHQLKPGESLILKPGDLIGYHDWHVSMPVLQATLSVSMALERKGKVPLVRIGTDMRRDELRGHPIIAIGSFSNPWTEQNVSGLRFTFDRGSSDREAPRIRDTQNPTRSWSLPHTYPEPQSKDYAIITRTFDPVTGEPFVSLAGLHSFGNQVAGEFVSQETSWDEVGRRAPAGWEKMNMQVLLETNIVGTTPGSPKILDVYFWK